VRPSTDDPKEDANSRYGGEHHRLSLIDRLGERVERELHHELSGRDPAFIARMLPVLDAVLAYFDPEVLGFERVPRTGPMLIVGNHSGGIYMPDHWAFFRRWIRERGVEEPLYSLGFDFLFALPGFSTLARRFGSVPASQANATRLLEQGESVIVYPGGDEDDYRPWTERHLVELHGRAGFVRLALRQQVPVVPMVAHGSHDAIIVVTRGDALARRLGLDRLRIKILPLVAGPPWGIAPVIVPTWPLPAKVTVQVCEPIDWSHLGREAADDPDVVRRCYDQIVEHMQANLDALVATHPHPILARISDPLRRGSHARGNRP
jgi:1-acyl-sn-glycerol-3-phosphate acyltransferase